MSPECRKLLLDAERLFIAATREVPTIHKAYTVGTAEGLDLGQMALLVVPSLLNQIFDLQASAVALPKPFIVDKADVAALRTKLVPPSNCRHCSMSIRLNATGSWVDMSTNTAVAGLCEHNRVGVLHEPMEDA